MIPISTFKGIQSAIQKVKEHKKGYLTNFFMDIPRIDLWIKLNLLEYQVMGETVFFAKKNQDFSNLFFCTTSLDSFSTDLDRFISEHSDNLYVADIIGKNSDVSELKNVFYHYGFNQYTSLVRMSREVGQHSDTPAADHISYANVEKAYGVLGLLQKYFDPYAEQLPLPEELAALADNNRIMIYSNDGETVQGFLIFELTGQTSYLRYWFVHPEHREEKIGAKLLRKFFADSRNTKRQLFWVIETNQNAIKRYEHFGFNRELLCDNILINREIAYEG